MRRTRLAMLLACSSLLPGLASAKRPAAGRGEEVKVVARGDWPHVPVYAPAAPARKQQQWAFRDEKQFTEVAGPHAARTVARALKVEAIDWKKQMVLAAADGTQPLVGVSGGGPPSAPNRIEISQVEVDEGGKAMTVRLAPRAA